LTVAIALAIIALIILVSTYYFAYLPTTNQTVQIVHSAQQNYSFVTEFRTQSNETSPNAIAVDSSGSVWFMLENESKLAQLFPANQTIHEYQLPDAQKNLGAVTWGMTIQSSKNLIWFTEAVSDAVWSFNIATHAFTKYAIRTSNSFPFGIAVDKQGNVWFTELFGNKLGEISANTGSITEFNIPINAPYGAEPSGITVDDNGAIWMTLPGVDGIGSYSQGNFQFYNMTGLVVSPVGIAADSQGNLWFTQHGPSFLSEFNPTTHYFRTISTSIPPLNTSLPYFDYVDSNGDVLLNEHYGNAIALFNPATETLTEYEIPTRPTFTGGIAGMLTMALSPQNIPWFTELFTGSVGMVNTSEPVGLGLEVQNNTGMFGNAITIGNGSSFSIDLSIENANSSTVTLATSIGNFTGSVVLSSLPPNSTVGGNASNSNEETHLFFTFSENSSNTGNFASMLTMRNSGAMSGVYFVTISAQTANVVVSRIIEIIVP